LKIFRLLFSRSSPKGHLLGWVSALVSLGVAKTLGCAPSTEISREVPDLPQPPTMMGSRRKPKKRTADLNLPFLIMSRSHFISKSLSIFCTIRLLSTNKTSSNGRWIFFEMTTHRVNNHHFVLILLSR